MALRRAHESSENLWRNEWYYRNEKEARALINSLDLTYDGKRIRWTRTFEGLQDFVAKVLEEQGKWSPKVSSSRKFTSSISDLGLTWYYNKQKTLLFQGNSGTNLREILIKLCENSALIESTRSDGRLSLSVFNQGSDIEIVSVINSPDISSISADCVEQIATPNQSTSCVENIAFAPVTGGASCKCSCVTDILIEFENMKINMEILESRTDALQSLANVQKLCFSSSEYSNEINRLNQELLEERYKTSQLESDLISLKKTFSDFEQKHSCQLPKTEVQTNKVNYTAEETLPHKQFNSIHMVNRSVNKENNYSCIEAINLPLIDVPQVTLSYESSKSLLKANKDCMPEITSILNQSEAIQDGNCPLEKRIARKPELKADTKHKGQKHTETRDRDELLFSNNKYLTKVSPCQQNKARSKATASPDNVISDEEKQQQQIQPQQLENLYMKPKNWISYLPLSEMPIHKHVQVKNSDILSQNDQIENQSPKSPTKPTLNKYISSGKRRTDSKKGKVNKKNISSFGSKHNYIDHHFPSRNQQHPPFRRHRRDRHLTYLPSYQDQKKDWLNYLHFVRQNSMT